MRSSSNNFKFLISNFKLSGGFSVLHLAVVVAFLMLIAAGVVLVVQPLEQAKISRDEEFSRDAAQLVSSVGSFYVNRGRMPWADPISLTDLAPPLAWSLVKAPTVGLCGNAECTDSGELVEANNLPVEFLGHDFVSGRQGPVYIGKALGVQSPIHVCFIPSSEALRSQEGGLKRITLDRDVPVNLASCPTRVSWDQEDVCFFCVTK